MSFDEIDEIETFNAPNSCHRPDDEQLYMITEWDGTVLMYQTKDDVINYTVKELTTLLFKINTAYSEEGEEAAFEVAKNYLEQFSAIEEEKTDE